jgi:hypothetical protein
MNKKQEVVLWIWGLVIAYVFVAGTSADNRPTAGFTIVGLLTFWSLRTRRG